jgi:YHS domain-containing protein
MMALFPNAFSRVALVVLPAMALTAAAALAETPANVVAHYNIKPGEPAIKGYDPVTYFAPSGPQKGREQIMLEHRGVTYRFVSEENRDRFAADPAKYVPSYGGWCATAMADGRKVDIDPANFKITDGRLLLFYKGLLGDGLKPWNKDEANLLRKADEQWKKLVPSDGR